MGGKGVLSTYMRWKPSYPDLDVDWVYLEIGPSSVKLKRPPREDRVIYFDTLELSESAGTITARRNGDLVLQAWTMETPE